MYFRKRIASLKKDSDIKCNVIACTNKFESINKICLKPSFFEEEEILDEDSLPHSFILQAIIEPTFCENDKTLVRATEKAPFFSLYSKNHDPLKKAIRSMKFIFEAVILDPLNQTDYSCTLEIPDTLLNIDFLVTSEGNYTMQEKRSPQDDDHQVLEQSLWSYGGTYNIDFDVCQVLQTSFFPIFLNGKTMIRSVKSSKSLSIGDLIVNGEIKLKFKDSKKQFYYQSFFIKNITASKAHIHFKKCSLE
ncbi:MAG: hypothetical protein HEEMFOPI_00156 [Holosporales bacterium]